MKVKMLIILSLSLGFISQSCENEGPDGQETSFFGETESHNTGKACMPCHIEGGEGEGWFKIAGTVYDSLQRTPYPNATVLLYTEPRGGGSLVHTIEVDGRGNFYTTNNIEYGNGLYVSVKGSLSTKNMNTAILAGDCNACHGVSTDRIWTK
jgi:hypothetical protein